MSKYSQLLLAVKENDFPTFKSYVSQMIPDFVDKNLNCYLNLLRKILRRDALEFLQELCIYTKPSPAGYHTNILTIALRENSTACILWLIEQLRPQNGTYYKVQIDSLTLLAEYFNNAILLRSILTNQDKKWDYVEFKEDREKLDCVFAGFRRLRL
jgi:hypothetical protein